MNWSKYWEIVCLSPSNDSFDNSAVVLNKQAGTTESQALSKGRIINPKDKILEDLKLTS